MLVVSVSKERQIQKPKQTNNQMPDAGRRTPSRKEDKRKEIDNKERKKKVKAKSR
jgi:hypothetical protein